MLCKYVVMSNDKSIAQLERNVINHQSILFKLLSSLEYIRPSVIQNGVIENYKFDLVDYFGWGGGVSFDTLHMLESKVFSNQDTK